MRVRAISKVGEDDRVLSVTPGREYEVIEICCDDFRLLDDFGEPVLIDRVACEVTDETRPDDWISEIHDGCEYAGPEPFVTPGFWEDFFEDRPGAVQLFWRHVNDHLRIN